MPEFPPVLPDELDSTARVRHRVASGADVGPRRRFNWPTGTVLTDSPTNEEVSINLSGVATAFPSAAAPALTLSTSNAAGVAATVIRTDATVAVFDATVPTTQAIGDAAATGSAGVAARRDHKHAMPVAADIYALAQTLNAQTGTTYTFVAGDAGKLVTLSNGSAITLTVPANSSVAYATGTRLDFAQIGAGQVTVAGAGGVTVNATPGLKCRAQYSGATLVKVGTDSWLLLGDLST